MRTIEPMRPDREHEASMKTHSDPADAGREAARPDSAEQRWSELALRLPEPPEPFGAYVEAVQAGSLLFLSGMLPTEGRVAKFTGRVGAELDVDAGRQAARLAALNVLAVVRRHLGSFDRVVRVVRLGVSVATSGDVRDQPRVADAASELLEAVFGKDRTLAASCTASPAFRSASRSSWKSSSRSRRRARRFERHDETLPFALLEPAAATLPHGPRGARPCGRSAAGPSPRKERSMEHPTVYRTITGRRALDLLPGGGAEGRTDAAAAARAAVFVADVRAALRPALRSLSPRRARLPGFRTQRLAGPEAVRLHVRSLSPRS